MSITSPARARRTSSLLLAAIAVVVSVLGCGPAFADEGNHDTNVGVGVNINPTPNLDELDTTRAQINGDVALAPKKTPAVTLVSSWPHKERHLWLPPREAELVFDKPVRPIDVSLEFQKRSSNVTAAVSRSLSSKDLKSIRFSVDGVTQGEWVAVWRAGESTGTFSFTMDATPRSVGGGNHREHANATDSGQTAGKLAIPTAALAMAIALTAGIRRRGRKDLALAAAAGVATIASLVMAVSALDFSSSKELAGSLSTSNIWSWLTLAASMITLVAVRRKEVRIATSVVAVGSIATMPWVADLTSSYEKIPALAVTIGFAVLLLAISITTNAGVLWGRNVALLSAGALAVMSIGNLLVASGYSGLAGDFGRTIVLRLVASAVLVASVLALAALKAKQAARATSATTAGADVTQIGTSDDTPDATDESAVPANDTPAKRIGLKAVGQTDVTVRLLLALIFIAVVVLTQVPPGRAGF